MSTRMCTLLLPLIFLRRIVPVRINAGPPCHRAFHALAVDDGGGRTGFPLRLFEHRSPKRVVDPSQRAVIGPQIELSAVDQAFYGQPGHFGIARH